MSSVCFANFQATFGPFDWRYGDSFRAISVGIDSGRTSGAFSVPLLSWTLF